MSGDHLVGKEEYEMTVGEATYDFSNPFVFAKSAQPAQTYILATFPETVGFWCLHDGNPNVRFSMWKKPTDEQIANTEALLGWKWKDA